jgi:hypothetical protein
MKQTTNHLKQQTLGSTSAYWSLFASMINSDREPERGLR